MFRIFEEMGLDPVVTPKFLNAPECIGCGHCDGRCPFGVKVAERMEKTAQLLG